MELEPAFAIEQEGGTIGVHVEHDNRDRVVVAIRDDGPGIPLEDQPRVFDRFYRVDKARWRESGGAGLGLSITKWVVEAHGGSVTLESEINRGVYLPHRTAGGWSRGHADSGHSGREPSR